MLSPHCLARSHQCQGVQTLVGALFLEIVCIHTYNTKDTYVNQNKRVISQVVQYKKNTIVYINMDHERKNT